MCLDGAEAAAGIVFKVGLEGLLSDHMWGLEMRRHTSSSELGLEHLGGKFCGVQRRGFGGPGEGAGGG